jgi:GNAT superfamily N-acetyltransferase
MRALSLGPVPWGCWSWTFHDGSCWAALGFLGGETTEAALVGWAAVTLETDLLPVVGVYVQEQHRGQGLGKALVTNLLQSSISGGILSPGDAVFNSTWRWPAYEQVIQACGLRSLPWK